MANYDLTYEGPEVQDILNAGNTLEADGYIFCGVATPSTNPGTPTEKVYYQAKEAGTYTNFGGAVLAEGLHLLIWNGSAWSTQTFFTVDNVPTAGSENLVKSEGVFNAIENKAQVDGGYQTKAELSFVDEEDNCIAKFQNGHIKTKFFDSSLLKNRGTIIADFSKFTGSGWSISNNKKVATTTGNNRLMFNEQNINAWDFRISACLKPVGSTFSVGIGKVLDYVVALSVNSALFALEFDGTNSKLAVYRMNDSGAVVSTPAQTHNLSNIVLSSGKKYWLTVVKTTTDYSKYTVTVTDEYGNAETISNIYATYSSSMAGFGWGAPCAFKLSGTSLEVSDFSFGFPIDGDAKCLMFGHSWVEANTTGMTEAHDLSFAGKIETALGKQYCANFARGGQEAPHLLTIVNLFKQWLSQAKYALLCIGLNDLNPYIGTASFASKETELEQNMLAIEKALLSNNITPVWLSVAWTPYKGKPATDSINPWMKSNLMNVVDINKVFEDGNGNLVESAFISDKNHPTVESSGKIFNCIKAQAAYLFNS